MTTANDLLLRQRIRHAVDLQSYSNATVRDIIALLNEADRDLLAQLAKRMDKVGTWTNRRLQAILVDMAAANAENYKEAANRLTQEMIEYAGHEAEQAAAGIESVKPPTEGLPPATVSKIDVAFSMTLPTADQLAAIVSKEPITVGPDGKLLLEEIFKGLAAGKETRIRQAVRLGMVEGETTPQIVRRLIGTRAARYTDGILERDRRNVSNMVRTIISHTSNRAAVATYQSNSSVIKGILRLETLDLRTCKQCMPIDHTVVPLDSTQLAPFHIGCRGFSAPQTKSFREMGIPLDDMSESTRASMDGQLPESTTYSEWLKSQPMLRVKEALGPTRAKLFMEGNMPVSHFTDNAGHTLTLPQLRERQSGYFKRAGVE